MGESSDGSAMVTNPALREELLEMSRVDQEARTRDFKGLEENKQMAADMQRIDAANTLRLHEIVEEFGWPTISMVGEDGAKAAWLLIQHADHDVDFQAKCLGLMEELIASGGVRKKDVAYLTDRVLLNQGKEQIFGTQFQSRDNGNWFGPRPLANPEGVEERRHEYGLKPFAEYEAEMQKMQEEHQRRMRGE